MQQTPLLEIEHLEIRGAAGAVVSDVGFSVAAGEIVCVVGESGCGKSLSALAVLDLLPPGLSITGGGIRFEGKDVLPAEARRKLRGRAVGMIFQEPATALNPVYTIGFQIGEMLPALSRARRKARIAELLDRVGLPPATAASYPHQLSGGMKQRAMIAMALAGEPRLLLCDEPTTALDPTVGAQILAQIQALAGTETPAGEATPGGEVTPGGTGIGVVLITHDFHAVSRMRGRIVVMYAGQIVERGPIRGVLDHPAHPYTAALLDTLPKKGKRPGSIPGQVPPPGMRPVGCPFTNRCRVVLERCEAEPPPWLDAGGGQFCRCWRDP
ncbi:ABC transporter ATP-binding protein [Myxococcota bacterium]|nr:ABC transporter ATP-binding protein [Myxococcota bacterium]MBU1411152.1 ABC transporter ATP-binding protein [Myxococcota bacterium]MBU1509726.1 ABC transporter ATP-binding protein [Myxococcota bacterium]PKN25666.1 MAG: peptide ABC transporter ATP-binding protein [Deltaproteobacteria bacterium HGW-Deltaproteobacteria-22]